MTEGSWLSRRSFAAWAAVSPLLALAGCQTSGGGGRSSVIAKAKPLGLLHVPDHVPGVRVDLRYRTSSNATGKPLYPPDMPCLLHRSAVDKLAKAQKILRREGYGLLILDAWRPPESHAALWNAVQDSRWVVPPWEGLSLHCYGLAVDVTLVDSEGREQRMPSAFDEFSPRARSDYQGPDPDIRRNVALLQGAMKQAGFRAIPDEWWHFDLPGPVKVYRVEAATLGLPLPQ